MARTEAFRGIISTLRVLDENGELTTNVPPLPPDDALVAMYGDMMRTRLLDERAFLLQREGRLGTYAPSLGQEGAQIGSVFALEPTDWVVPSYRENGVLLARNVPMENILLYWGGDERGMLGMRERRCLPYSVPVGTQIPHGVGLAMASRLEGGSEVTCVYFGDGATSTGDFHEALTFAGVFRAPVVFLCQNNQWAISVPRERQCAAETLAQKALGYGIEGIQVDGNDALACYDATREAVERARSGAGATLVEALTYRLGDHTTADDSKRYREAREVETWRRRDPLERLRRFLSSRGLWDEAREEHLRATVDREIDAAVDRVETIDPPDPADITRFTWARPPVRRTSATAPLQDGIPHSPPLHH